MVYIIEVLCVEGQMLQPLIRKEKIYWLCVAQLMQWAQLYVSSVLKKKSESPMWLINMSLFSS